MLACRTVPTTVVVKHVWKTCKFQLQSSRRRAGNNACNTRGYVVSMIRIDCLAKLISDCTAGPPSEDPVGLDRDQDASAPTVCCSKSSFVSYAIIQISLPVFRLPNSLVFGLDSAAPIKTEIPAKRCRTIRHGQDAYDWFTHHSDRESGLSLRSAEFRLVDDVMCPFKLSRWPFQVSARFYHNSDHTSGPWPVRSILIPAFARLEYCSSTLSSQIVGPNLPALKCLDRRPD